MGQAPFPGDLIVHIGDHKAGSTSIQTSLARGDVRLTSGSLAYPLIGNRYNQNHLRRAIAPRGLTLKRLNPDRSGLIRLAEIARKADPAVTVLSAEELETAPPRLLRKALGQHFGVAPGKLHVVSYLRPHAGRAVSGLAEKIKIGWAKDDPLEGYARLVRLRLRYAPRLKRVRRAFGDAYRVRPLLREELAEGSPLADLFAVTIGRDRVEIDEGPRSNESLGVEDLMRLHVIHRALPQLSKWQHHALGWVAADQLRAAHGPDERVTPLKIHRALAEDVRKALMGDARAVDSAFFDGRPLMAAELDRAVDAALPEPMSLRPADWLAQSEIAALREKAKELGKIAGRPGGRNALKSKKVEALLRR